MLVWLLMGMVFIVGIIAVVRNFRQQLKNGKDIDWMRKERSEKP
jgi:hypothetical protein